MATRTVTVPCLAMPWAWGRGRFFDADGNLLPPAPLPQPPMDCTKHAYKDPARRPSDFYVNPRYGQACDCCGHQGTHTVDVDADPATLPTCLRGYGVATAMAWSA